MLEIRLLGGFEVRYGGRVLEIPSQTAQSLLAYLVLNPRTLHRREMLAGLLWPASTEQSARNNLRQALWRIRKALTEAEDVDRDYLVADGFTIGFNPQSPHWLDVSVIEQEPDPSWPSERLVEVIEVYRGELLPGFYEDWVILERERLKAVYERRMRTLVDKLLQERQWPAVLHWTERWIAGGEVPEPAFRALMLASHAMGDNAAAIAAYQRCSEALRRELGVEPSSQTEDLHREISQGRGVTDTLLGLVSLAEASKPWISVERTVPAFLVDAEGRPEPERPVHVGRERELRRLGDFLEAVLAGGGLAAMVTGDAGTGKTALLREFALRAQAQHDDLMVVSGSGNALTGEGDPYLLFRDVLGMLTGDVEAKWVGGAITKREARQLWDLLPLAVTTLLDRGPDLIDTFVPGSALLSRSLSHTRSHPETLGSLQRLVERNALRRAETVIGQSDLFEQYTRVVHAIADRHPLVLVLDDLQWADPHSLGLLFHISRRIADCRVLILGAYRPIDGSVEAEPGQRVLAELLSEFRRAFGDVHIDLGMTCDAEGRSFVEEFLDTEPNVLDHEFRSELHRHTSGNPLFTIELLRAMETRGDIVRDAQGRWIRGAALNWDELPARVEGVIDERLNRLGDDLLQVLDVAAVEGEEFTAEVIARVLGLTEREVVHRLSAKLDKQFRLVSALGSRRLGAARRSVYRFRHILFQKHLYNRLDAVQRSYVHQDVGESLEALYGEQLTEMVVQLARQFSEAGLADKAIRYLQAAAQRGRHVSAYEEAVSYLGRALGLLESLPSGVQRQQLELELQAALGVSLIATRGYAAPEVEQAHRRGRELCRELGESPQLFPVLHASRTFYLVRAEYQTAHELGKQLLTIAETARDPELLVEAHQAAGTSLFYLGEFTPARTHLERCLELYRVERDSAHAVRFGQDPAVACHSYLGLTSWVLGHAAAGTGHAREALGLADRLSHPYSMALALVFAGLMDLMMQHNESAREHVTAAEALSSQRGFPSWRAMASMLRGCLLASEGEEAGVERIRAGLVEWESIGSRLGRPYFLGLLAEALTRKGDPAGALSILDQALDEVSITQERFGLAELYRWKGQALHRLGEPARAESALRQAIDLAKGQQAIAFELRAAIGLWHSLGGAGDSATLLREATGRISEGEDFSELTQARDLLARGGARA